MFKFFINTTELSDQPIGWEEFQTRFDFNLEERTMLFTYPSSMQFWGQGWKILRDLKELNVCTVADIEIQQECGNGYETIFEGKIFIPDVTWTRWNCIASTELMDENFSALIKNNWNINFHGFAENTKNGLPLPKLSGKAIDLFDPTALSLVYQSTNDTWMAHGGFRTAYDIMDYMKHQVRFMTDDVLALRSDWYDALDDDQRSVIMSGRELRNGATLPSTDPSTIPDISFFALWDFLHKSENLVLFIKDGEVRIEPISYVENLSNYIDLGSIKKVTESVDQDIMYSKVKVGTKTFYDDGVISVNTRYLTHKEEEYHIATDCNIDKTFDLVSTEVIYDTNTIEDVMINDTDSHDDEVFVIQYSHLVDLAIADNIFNPIAGGPYQYNERYTNVNVLNRYKFPGDLVYYRGEPSDFRAETIPDISFLALDNAGSGLPPTPITHEVDPFVFNDDSTPPNFDTLGNYNNITGEFTAPISGIHVFNYQFLIDRLGIITDNNSVPENFEIEIQRLEPSPSVVVIDRKIFESGIINFPELPPEANVTSSYTIAPTTPVVDIVNRQHQDIRVNLDWQVNLGTGDRVKIIFRVNHNFANLEIADYVINGIFSLTSAPAYGGIFSSHNINDFDLLRFEIDNKSLDLETVKAMQVSPDFSFRFSDDVGSVKAFPKSMIINNANGTVELEMRSRENLISL